MKTTVYLSRKLLNQLKVKETESKDLMLTHNLHNIIINGNADEEQDRKANESGAMLYGMEYWHLVEDVEFRVNHINAQYKLFTVFDIMEAFDKLLISKKLGDFVPSGENRYRLYAKILSCLRSIREKL